MTPMPVPTPHPTFLYQLVSVNDLFSNCACPVDSGPVTLPAISPVGQWRIASGLYQTAISPGHHLAFNPVGSVGVIVLNDSAHQLLQSFQQPRSLDDPHAQTLATLQLLQPLDTPTPTCLSHATSLTAWLHLTNACNLRCTYCYIHKTNEAMDESTARKAVEMLFQEARKHGYKSIKLKYAGGEASLNFGLIQRLHPYAQTLSAQSGIELETVMLTNGVRLTPEMLDFLHTRHIGLSVSLDGLGAVHDVQRPFLGGQPTSQLVQHNIDRALECGVKPHLSITVTEQNAATIADVAAFALERELFFNLNFYREHTEFAGARHRADNERLIAGVMNTLRVIEENLPSYNLLATLIDRANFSAPHERPCGVGDNYMVIDHHGHLARCHMDIENTIGHIWEPDPLLSLQHAGSTNDFINLSVDEKKECHTCQWRYWCAGGCPLTAYRTTGGSEAKSPYCDVYKAVFPGILRLEGLRLLKYQEHLMN